VGQGEKERLPPKIEKKQPHSIVGNTRKKKNFTDFQMETWDKGKGTPGINMGSEK